MNKCMNLHKATTIKNNDKPNEFYQKVSIKAKRAEAEAEADAAPEGRLQENSAINSRIANDNLMI